MELHPCEPAELRIFLLFQPNANTLDLKFAFKHPSLNNFFVATFTHNWPRHALNAAFVWYLVMLAFHGAALDAASVIQALGLSAIVGTLLTGNAMGRSPLRRRQVARFYLIPFCVSSFTAATAPTGFVVIFAPSLLENALASFAVAALLCRLDRLPPFWFLLAVLAQFALAWQASTSSAPLALALLGYVLLFGGIALVLAAAQRFHKWQTPIKPFQQPAHCITDGVFRYSRNPLYLGEVLMLLGLAALLGTWSALLPVPIFAAIIQWRFILPEERILEKRFGEPYRRYRSRARRWI